MEIDINSDLGEGFGRWKMGDDDELMKIISSANVACGFHAGDAIIMTRTVIAAKENGVALGAHVGLPDLLGFGRNAMDIKPEDMQKHALYQLGALHAIAKVNGARVTHAGTHGAMGAMAVAKPEYIKLILDAFHKFDPDLMYAAFPNGGGFKHAQQLGLRTIGKICADRAYGDDGQLVSRRLAGSVLTDIGAIETRVKQFLDDGTVTSVNGRKLKFEARSILVHSDTPGAVAIAEAVRNTVEKTGGRIVPFTDFS